MQVAPDTAAVMVTHDGARFIRAQCDSIFRQELLPAVLVVIDDASTDGTRDLLKEIARRAPIPVEVLCVDGSRRPSWTGRLAGGMLRGLLTAREYPYVILADQDDEWLADRLDRQRAALESRPTALLVAGDGMLMDEAGNDLPGRLRSFFPIPSGWDSMTNRDHMHATIRRPLVTGATAAIRSELVDLMSPIPHGWLHDRWASLVAATRDGLMLQPEPVIRYRVHAGQATGLRAAHIGKGGRRWRQILARGSSPVGALARANTVVRRLRPLASDSSIRAELSWFALLCSGVERA